MAKTSDRLPPPPDGPILPATISTASPHRLLERILDTPQLARAVPRLPPEVLHQLIRHCGLEDSGALIALATPQQLERVFDLDLWRSRTPGGDETFDPERFGEWVEVMVEHDVVAAAAVLAALDPELVTTALAQHVRVFDRAVVEPYISLDGEQTPTGYGVSDRNRHDVGGYVVLARRDDAWDAITAVLTALAAGHGDCFARAMRACARLSDAGRELDGLNSLVGERDQAMFNTAADREVRRHAQGYVTPADARAFLQVARRTSLAAGSAPPRHQIYDPVADADRIEDPGDTPVHSTGSSEAAAASDTDGAAVVAVVDLLRDAGVVAREPAGLLPSAHDARLTHVEQLLRAAVEDPAAFAAANAALAFLANALIAGTTIQSRLLNADEASAAAIAVCNLGLENWPSHWSTDDTGARPDLVAAFQVGWTLLHEDVCMYTADHLLAVLASLPRYDDETNAALRRLRGVLKTQLRAGTPWHARDALDAVAILDPVSWNALRGLIDEFPTLPAAVDASVTASTRSVSPTAFEFISGKAQILLVHAFADSLAGRLRG